MRGVGQKYLYIYICIESVSESETENQMEGWRPKLILWFQVLCHKKIAWKQMKNKSDHHVLPQRSAKRQQSLSWAGAAQFSAPPPPTRGCHDMFVHVTFSCLHPLRCRGRARLQQLASLQRVPEKDQQVGLTYNLTADCGSPPHLCQF